MVAERFHAPLIATNPAFELSHVVERHAARSQVRYPTVKVVRSHRELMEQPVDVVVVLTPNESHFEIARDALEAGKHVVLDKPMTVSSQEADELIDLAASRARILTVFQNRRWDSDFLTLKKVLAQGVLGRVSEVESRFDRFRPRLKGGWREREAPGAGILYDLGSHLFDQSIHLFGLPGAVMAMLLIERAEAKVVDGFRVSLDYGSFFVHLHSSCLAAERRVRFRVRGDRGAWLKHGLDPQEERLAQGELPTVSHWGEEPRELWGELYLEDGAGQPYPSERGDYPAFYSLLAEALTQGAPPPVAAKEARDAVRLIELSEESARLGRWVAWS